MRDIAIALLPVIGVALGALMQHWLARSKDKANKVSDLRHECYSDYLRAVSSIAINRSPESLQALVDAKCRMVVYASNVVVEHLSALEAAGSRLDTPEGRGAFARVATQMRIETGGSADSGANLVTILFGPK